MITSKFKVCELILNTKVSSDIYITYTLQKILNPRLKPENLKRGIHNLVRTHYRTSGVAPAVNQRPPVSFFRLEKPRVFLFFVMLGTQFIIRYVNVINNSLCQLFRRKLQTLEKKIIKIYLCKTNQDFLPYVFRRSIVVLVPRID